MGRNVNDAGFRARLLTLGQVSVIFRAPWFEGIYSFRNFSLWKETEQFVGIFILFVKKGKQKNGSVLQFPGFLLNHGSEISILNNTREGGGQRFTDKQQYQHL